MAEDTRMNAEELCTMPEWAIKLLTRIQALEKNVNMIAEETARLGVFVAQSGIDETQLKKVKKVVDSKVSKAQGANANPKGETT